MATGVFRRLHGRLGRAEAAIGWIRAAGPGPPNIPLELICHGGSFSVIFGAHFGGRFRFFAHKLAQNRSFSVVSGI